MFRISSVLDLGGIGVTGRVQKHPPRMGKSCLLSLSLSAWASGDDLVVRRLGLDTSEDLLDDVDVIAGIDDDCLARRFVAEDRAVALQSANRDNFVDHVLEQV